MSLFSEKSSQKLRERWNDYFSKVRLLNCAEGHFVIYMSLQLGLYDALLQW